ncbi:MAG: diadenylate cyclase CdaA [Prevotella sp.]|nr:diadenylate cyclase CdaA [Prevotella sp.]MBQ9178312.1 diadenylate cyclase CdaA [Prevotella sp.]MBR1526369.1 diadenylate cyclase CdaA [Prevotella sp.]
MITFLNFGIKDFIDIFLVATMLFYIYRLMKKSRSINVFTGIIIFLILWLIVSQILEMKLLGAILDKFVSYGVIALIVLFQDEIRKFLYSLGTHQRVNKLFKWFTNSHNKKDADKKNIMPIVMACMNMAKGKVGALIVIERKTPLDDIIKSGEIIDSNINQRLIENIFFKNSPLHDGAMVIQKKRIVAAGCILPVSHDTNIPKALGLRHRAAMGMSQESDALTIIVSEETGYISVAMQGSFQLNLSAEELESLLTKELGEN